MRAPNEDFVEPEWDAPLDVARALSAIPETRTISGMFLAPLVREARRLSKQLPSARERYVAFQFYPLREHASLLLEACPLLFPGKSVRFALRKLGRAAPSALLTSTLGRASVGVAQGPAETIEAMAKAYAINVPGSELTLHEQSARQCIVRIRKLPYFVDCHHVGAFEGVLRHAGAQGEVRIRAASSDAADLLCRWK